MIFLLDLVLFLILCGVIGNIFSVALTLSAPQDVTNVIETRSRFRVLGTKSSYFAEFSIFFFFFFFLWFYEKVQSVG